MESEREYLSRRAREEQDAAEHAASEKVRNLHMAFAARYREAAEGPVRKPDRKTDLEMISGASLPREFRIIE